MKHFKVLFFLLIFVNQTKAQSVLKFVDPLIGSSESRWEMFPGPTMPFGMVKVSPDNQDKGWKSGYEYTIGRIKGFSHIHSWGMTGLRAMPTTGYLKYKGGSASGPVLGARSGYLSRFRHENETAEVGYYSVFLDDYKIKAELTSTTRCAFHRYTFPKADEARILFDMMVEGEYPYQFDHFEYKKASPTEVEGMVHIKGKRENKWSKYKLHFVVRTNKPFQSIDTWQDGSGKALKNRDSLTLDRYTRTGFALNYSTADDEILKMQVGISLVSKEQARLNLDTELKKFNWNFEAAVQSNKQAWEAILGKVKIKSRDTLALTKFYTNLYRSYTARTIWSDVNGKYVDACEEIRTHETPMYGSDALWNSYWNLNGLWSLLTPRYTEEWTYSLLEMYKQTEWLPKGPSGIEYSGIMHGCHSIPFVVSAYQKGIAKKHISLAMEACEKAMSKPGIEHACGGHAGNMYLKPYLDMGYVPLEIKQSSIGLDYAFDDWCTGQLASKLGLKKKEKLYLERSKNYTKLFDPETKTFRPKLKDGSFMKDYSLFASKGFTEGNGWQYQWYTPHAIPELVEMKGIDSFNSTLENGFREAEKHGFAAFPFEDGVDKDLEFYVNHGNQVNMHCAYLFNYSGKPWLTQKYVDKIRNKYYGHTPFHGWLGDEDQGQMGAWYVMSCLGLFEMEGGASAKPRLTLTSPSFKEISLSLDDHFFKGKMLKIKCQNWSKEHMYIQSVKLNGKRLKTPFVYFEDLVKGGVLEFSLGDEPNKRCFK